jgi:hypothetical protein
MSRRSFTAHGIFRRRSVTGLCSDMADPTRWGHVAETTTRTCAPELLFLYRKCRKSSYFTSLGKTVPA